MEDDSPVLERAGLIAIASKLCASAVVALAPGGCHTCRRQTRLELDLKVDQRWLHSVWHWFVHGICSCKRQSRREAERRNVRFMKPKNEIPKLQPFANYHVNSIDSRAPLNEIETRISKTNT